MQLTHQQQLIFLFDRLNRLAVDLDNLVGALDQRLFDTFSQLDLLPPAARDLAQEVEVRNTQTTQLVTYTKHTG